MAADRRMLAAPALAVPLLAGMVIAGLVLARRLKRAATTTILAFEQDSPDVYFAAALAGDHHPHQTASMLADHGTEATVANEDADVFFAAALAGDAHPYETAVGSPHLS